MTQIIKKEKNQWDEFYLNDENKMISDQDRQIMNSYGVEDRKIEFEDEFEDEMETEDGSPQIIKNFYQARKVNRTFINRGNSINAFQINQDNNDYQFLYNLPTV